MEPGRFLTSTSTLQQLWNFKLLYKPFGLQFPNLFNGHSYSYLEVLFQRFSATISGMLQQIYTKPPINMFLLLIPFVLIPGSHFFNSLQSLDKGKITSVQGVNRLEVERQNESSHLNMSHFILYSCPKAKRKAYSVGS